ncbi:MAG: hypothetical protein JO369_05645 [Paucibacter sp.]|nr:hypothetical protein [Roseateles sp.]
MISISVVFALLGLLLVIGVFYGAGVGRICEFEFRSVCQGASWRRAFPGASKASIREFLELFVEAFAFPSSKRLTFSPDDQILPIYRRLYPSRWIPDALELETFAKDLEARSGLRLESIWSERLTLGQVFAAMHEAQQVGKPLTVTQPRD